MIKSRVYSCYTKAVMPANIDHDEQSLYPPTDESGDVDLTLIEGNLRLTVEQRFERHYQARRFAELMRRAGEQFYGSTSSDPQAT
jgi:hypothetical protein